jgi:putative transcriptional regulator
MNDELFSELVESVRKGGAIMRGEKEPSRKFVVEAPDVKRISTDSKLARPKSGAKEGCAGM